MPALPSLFHKTRGYTVPLTKDNYYQQHLQLSDAIGDFPARFFGAGFDIVFSAEGFKKLKENLRRTMLELAREFMSYPNCEGT